MYSINLSTFSPNHKFFISNQLFSICFSCILLILLVIPKAYSQENIPVTAGIDDNVSNLIAYDGYLFFSANTAANVTEIFYYDNNVPVKVSSFGTDSDPQEFTVLNGKLYFSAISQQGSTDRLLHVLSNGVNGYEVDPIPGTEGANNFIFYNSFVYLQGTSSMLRVDVNDNSEEIAADVGVSGLPNETDSDRKRIFVSGNKLFYNKSLGIHYVDLTAALPNFDTVGGTDTKEVFIGGTYSSYHIGSKVLCNVYDSGFNSELYLIDASSANPTGIPIELSTVVNNKGTFFTQYMGRLYFVAFHDNVGRRVFYIDDTAIDVNSFDHIPNYEATPNNSFEDSDPFQKIDNKLYHWSDEIDFTTGQISTSECFGGKPVISSNGRYYYFDFSCVGCSFSAANLQSCSNNTDKITETCLNGLDNFIGHAVELNGDIFFNTSNPDTYELDLWKWSGSNVGLCAPPPCDQDIKPDLHVENGDVYLDESCRGVIFTTSNDDCYRMTVNDNGDLETTLVTCPN